MVRIFSIKMLSYVIIFFFLRHETDEGIEEDQSELEDSRPYDNLTLFNVLEVSLS